MENEYIFSRSKNWYFSIFLNSDKVKMLFCHFISTYLKTFLEAQYTFLLQLVSFNILVVLHLMHVKHFKHRPTVF